MINEKTKEYYNLTKKNEVREAAKKLRRQFLCYVVAFLTYLHKHEYCGATLYSNANLKIDKPPRNG